MSQEVTVLEQTKSSFRLRGIVTRLSNENAYKEGVIERGKNKGKKSRQIRLGLKTNLHNELFPELFVNEQAEITIFKTDDRSKKKIPFAQRNKLPEGYEIVDTQFELETDETGNPIIRKLQRYDAPLYLKKYLKDGDSVYISGTIEHSEYPDKLSGQIKQTRRLTIKNVSKIDPIDFNSEKFRETAAFEQEIVFVSSLANEGRVYVTGRVINYGNKYTDVQFVFDPKDDDDLKTADAFENVLQFGDVIKINGNIVNKVVTVAVEGENTSSPFGSKKANGYGKSVIRDTVRELQIIGVDAESYEYGKGKYKEEDFFVEEYILPPSEGDSVVDISEDDLPF